MTNRPAAIELAFREIVAEKRFRSITVKEICERAGVSRKVFYVHFDSKDDIVDKVFKRDVLQPVPMRGNDFTFINIASSSFYDLYSRMLARLGYQKTGRQSEYVASYFGSAHAQLLQKWICDDYPMSASKIAETYVAMALPFWKSIALHSG